MKFKSAFGVVAIVLCAAAHAAPPALSFAKLSPTEQEAQAPTVLQSAVTPRAEIFALGGIGRGGTGTDKYLAYEAILRRKDAPAIFQNLLTSRSPVTQLFALTGLAKSAPRTFRRVAPRFTRRKDKVQTAQGCLVGTQPFGELVQNLLASGYPFSSVSISAAAMGKLP